MREPGFYWVKLHPDFERQGWIVAELRDEEYYCGWEICACDEGVREEDLIAVHEVRLIPPDIALE